MRLIALTRLERNALWFGFGALITMFLVVGAAFNPFPDCNVSYIKLQGELVTYGGEGLGDSSSSEQYGVTSSEDVTQAIRDADSSYTSRAIVLEIDSPGGSPVAGEEIESALKAATKPTVALIRDQGDSAAYLAASGADRIFASPFSDVGDIGITSSYVDQSQEDKDSGLTFNQLSVGKYKDMFNTDKPLTDDERTLIEAQLQQYYQQFVKIVAKNRHLSIDTTTTLANGSGYTPGDALAHGLIDAIGGVSDVEDYLGSKLHTKATICGM